MIVFVLGYRGRKTTDTPEPLYLGQDAVAARKILMDPPAGFVRTELFKNPHCDKTRYHQQPDPVEMTPAPEVDGPQEIVKPVEEMDREELITEIEALTGTKPHGSSKDETLRDKLAELRAAPEEEDFDD